MVVSQTKHFTQGFLAVDITLQRIRNFSKCKVILLIHDIPYNHARYSTSDNIFQSITGRSNIWLACICAFKYDSDLNLTLILDGEEL